ncbi:unnamed protein product, partial [Gadus morhua 'NCC']
MGGRSQTLGALCLLLLLSLTQQGEILQEEWKDLSHDITALLNLRGLPDRMTHRSLLPAFKNTRGGVEPIIPVGRGFLRLDRGGVEPIIPVGRGVLPPYRGGVEPIIPVGRGFLRLDRGGVEPIIPVGRGVLPPYRGKTEIPPRMLDGLKDCPDFTVCVFGMKDVFDELLAEIAANKNQDWLLAASEVTYSYQIKLLLMTDNQQLTYDKAQQEYNLDPLYSLIIRKNGLYNASFLPLVESDTMIKIFGSFSEDDNTVSGFSGSKLANLVLKLNLGVATVYSIDGNTTTQFQHEFIRVFRSKGIKAVLETSQGDEHLYQMMGEMNTVSEYRTPKRPVDLTTHYDHQQILVMEDDPVVRKAANLLYDKHPAVSSVYTLDDHHKPKLIHGDAEPLSADSRLVLVGHGRKDNEGGTTVAGYNTKEVAEIIGETYRRGDEIKTVSVVACDVGSDQTFIETLMKELHEIHVVTELHLRNTELQVSHTGKKIGAEISPNGLEWRHKDDSQKVVATFDSNGNVVIREQRGNSGKAVFTSERNSMGKRLTKYRQNWPTAPKDFIHQEAIQENVKQSSIELQALAWALFYNPKTTIQKFEISELTTNEYIIGEANNLEMKWLSRDRISQMSFYDIKSGKDMLSIIRHYAKTGEDGLSYLMLNDFIYKVDPKTLYVYPIGKKLDNNEKDNSVEIENIKDCIKGQLGNEMYPDIRKNIFNNLPLEKQEAVKVRYVEYVRDTLRGEQTKQTLTLTERAWFNYYVTASVISESARNFRTFPQVLMALDMFENGDNNVKQHGLDFFFENHPMARGFSWIDPSSRGFMGSSSHKGSSKQISNKGLLKHLKKLISREDSNFKAWLKLTDNNVIANRIFDIAEQNSVLDEAQKKTSFEDYSQFKTAVEQQLQTSSPVNPERPQTSGSLGGSEDGDVTLQDLHRASESETSLKLASYYSRTSASFAKQIHDQLTIKYGKDLAGLHVKQDSAKMEDGTFTCQLLSADVNDGPIDFNVELHADSLQHNDKMLKSIEEAVHEMEMPVSSHHGSKSVERASTAVATLGLMLGMRGAVKAFNQGNIKDGVIGAAQTLHGVTGMTMGFVGRQAEFLEGRIAKSAGKLMGSSSMKRAMMVLPVVGIGFGIYNVEEDFKRKDALGLVDGVLDLDMVILDVVEIVVPELAPLIAPLNLAQSVIRMAIDDVYMGIQNELNSLPEDADTLDKLAAVLVGFEKGVFHLAIHVANFFYDSGYDEIEQGHKLVEQISDYHEYYKVTKGKGGTSSIDFNRGSSSWNGGGIRFDLKNQGLSEVCMDYFVSSDESFDRKCWDIDTSGSKDIILGTGESHQLEHQTFEKKVLLWIP